MTDTLLDRLRSGGIEEQEAATRISELEEARTADNHWIIDLQEEKKKLEARLAEANARAEAAERNVGVLQTQLANCHETMRKDGIRHAKLLLAIEDDEADAARLRAALEVYADKRHWRVSDSSVGYLDKWFDEDGPQIAEAALRPEQPAEKGEYDE